MADKTTKITYDIDQELNDLDDKPILRDEKRYPGQVTTAKTVILDALMMIPKDNMPSGADSADRYALALRLRAGGKQELSNKEIDLIKNLVSSFYGPLIVGQIYQLLK
jgi:hypothetical protein